MDVERFRRAEPVRVPDLRHEVVALHQPAGALEEDAQELELLHRELDGLPVPGDRPRVEVHGDVAARQDSAGRARGLGHAPPEDGAHAGTSSAALKGFVT